ncbi:MAG TPA: hypothetical protein VFX16_06210 [Pseudonocardiaceae bacterium]|nr:hypothetical protein [Pseudonocardiaceae bacterium]
MSLFSFRTNRKLRKNGRRLLSVVPPQLASYDPVFDAVDRIENDYHRFRLRETERYW